MKYFKETAYAVDSQLSQGEAAATSTKCNRDAMWCRDTFRKKNTFVVRDYDAQSSVESARQGRAWLGKARLSHTMVLGVESKLDDVSHRGSLKETNCQRNGQ